MTRVYVRREGDRKEKLGALAVSLGVGAVTYYLARMMMSRDAVELNAPRALKASGDERRLSKNGTTRR